MITTLTKQGEIKMSFTVSRQRRWDDGVNLVEITQGGIDYCNPDALVSKYRGEMEETISLSEAVENAIGIAEQWKQDNPKEQIFIACGNTHGMTAHLDEMELNEETYKQLREQAEKVDEKLPRCPHCGKILGKERYRLYDCCDGDDWFCSEYCAEEAYNDILADQEISDEFE